LFAELVCALTNPTLPEMRRTTGAACTGLFTLPTPVSVHLFVVESSVPDHVIVPSFTVCVVSGTADGSIGFDALYSVEYALLSAASASAFARMPASEVFASP